VVGAEYEDEDTNLTKEELDDLKPKGIKVVNPWIYE
jgi:hypothetical protein